MTFHLRLFVTDGICRVAPADAPDQPLAATPLADLPTVDALYKQPYALGSTLFEALGGGALLRQLEAHDADVLLLECDDQANAIAWEYAVTNEQRFLACDYGVLRLEPRDPRPTDTQTPPRLLVLCADPLVYPNGNPPPYQLDFPRELTLLEQRLAAGNRHLMVRRVPPVAERLVDALADGPALLHFSCHGSLVAGSGQRPSDVALLLEDSHGEFRQLMGRDLRHDAPRGSVRLVLLSACQSAPLAQAFVRDGVPVALGMQHTFPDPQSAALAGTFYRWLAAGQSVAEAVRQARRAIAGENPGAVGLLAAYTCENAWGALSLPAGQPDIQLGLTQRVNLPDSIVPPETGLLGRNRELVNLAHAYDSAPVVTINGFGGMGKTALAAAFLRRFGWRFRRVLGVSFANAAVDLKRVCQELLERAGLHQVVQQTLSGANDRDELVRALRQRLHERRLQQVTLGISADPAIPIEIDRLTEELRALEADDMNALTLVRLRERLLDAIQPGDLLLFDNYESVLTPDAGSEAAAQEVARLLPLLRDRGALLLLTSRTQPAGLTDEVLFPSQIGLGGLQREPAVELFLRSSPRARQPDTSKEHRQVAEAVAHNTDGYPLAIQLLASAYDQSHSAPELFLDQWPTMLANAERQGLGQRHARFATAVAFSVTPLTEQQRARLTTLASCDFPFFAEAAVFLWGLPLDDQNQPTAEALDTAHRELALFVNRSLIQVQGYFDDDAGRPTDNPASYRFQPALGQELRRSADEGEGLSLGYTAYGAWLARRAFGEISRDFGLSNLVNQSMALLDAATERLQGEERLWHIRRVAWIRQQYGDLVAARAALEQALQVAPEQTAVRGALQYQLASIYTVQGDLDEAMRLYRDSLAIHEALKDQQGKSATLHDMAYIYRVQGDLDEAMRLYRDSLAIDEALKDQQGKSATLHAMAYIYRVQGDLDEAMRLYRDSLAIKEALKDQQGKSATLHAMAYIYRVQGDLDEAMRLYRDSLAIHEALKDVKGKSATLHDMAYIYRVQGDLDEAMRLYRDSLAIHEALKDVKGKSATLHAMAYIYRVQGDLDEAMRLYRDSLAIDEALKDVKGKSATLHAMAYIYRVQGDLDEAMRLYRDSLAIDEALKDVRGKSATLHAMANIYTVQGDLDEAMRLYRESLSIHEALKDQQGKSTTLGAIANILMQQQNWGDAKSTLQLALKIANQLNNPAETAFNIVKLGQIAQAEGDLAAALANYRAGLAIHERLKMPRETQQVREMIAQAEAAMHQSVPLDAAISAWVASAEDDAAKAKTLVALLERIAGATVQACRASDRAGRVQLAEQLIPLRIALGAWAEGAHLPPFSVFLGCLQALLRGEDQLLARQRARLDEGLATALQEVERRIAAEETTLRAEARAKQISDLRRQVNAAMPRALRDDDQAQRDGFIKQLEGIATQAAAEEAPGSPWLALAAYLRGCVALLRGEPIDDTALTEDDRTQLAAWARGEFGDDVALPEAVRAALANSDEAALQAALAALPEEARAQVVAQLVAQMPAEQRAELERAALTQQCGKTAEQAAQAAQKALHDNDPAARAALAGRILAAAHYAEGKRPGSAYDELATFLRAVAAVLQGLPAPAVPPAYAEQFATLQW